MAAAIERYTEHLIGRSIWRAAQEVNGNLAGLIALAEIPRPEAKPAIAELKCLGIEQNVLSVILGSFRVIGPVVGAIMHELPALAKSARIIQYKPEQGRNAAHG